jgi:hypothetical protein
MDLQEIDYAAAEEARYQEERDEANRDAPEPAPLDLDDWYQQWSLDNAPDIVFEGETEDGVNIWRLV